jgi:hypothetical protein
MCRRPFSILVLVCALFLSLAFYASNAKSASNQNYLKVKNPDNGHWYQRFDGPMGFHEAQNYCDSLGGHLVTIISSTEDAFVYSIGSWGMMGATDEGHEGNWTWVTGEPMTYTNWAPYEPNNGVWPGHDGPYTNYMNYTPAYPGKWDDVLDGAGPITCEWEPTCQVSVNPLYQSSAPWGDDLYDSTSSTIQGKGCYLTALSMALNYVGVVNDPGTLNEFMINEHTFQHGGNVDPWATVSLISHNSLRFSGVRSSQSITLKNMLCQGYPTIVGVNGNRHFVLVTASIGDTFEIIDPGHSTNHTLESYNNIFETRGIVIPGTALASTTAFLTKVNPEIDQGEIVIAVNDLRIAVGDAGGNKSGVDQLSGAVIESIPLSNVFIDRLDDDVTGEMSEQMTTFVQIRNPGNSTYWTDLYNNSENLTFYKLSVNQFTENGKFLPRVTLVNALPAGGTITQAIHYFANPIFIFLPIIGR